MTYWLKRHLHFSVLGLLVLGLYLISFTDQTESQNSEKTYDIDTVHSSVLFRAKHMGVAYFYGRFQRILRQHHT